MTGNRQVRFSFYLAEWYWFVLALWAVVFISFPLILGIGTGTNPLSWMCWLMVGPFENNALGFLRPLSFFAPAPILLVPFAIKRRT
jgi:hypothetical protein